MTDKQESVLRDSAVPDWVFRLRYNVVSSLLLGVYVLLFAVLYRPTFSTGTYDLETWPTHFSFCVPLMSAIVAGVAALCRLLLYLLHTYRPSIRRLQLLLAMGVEILVIGLFEALFLSLYFHIGYIDNLTTVLVYTFLVLVPPYIGLWLYLHLHEARQRLTEATAQVERLQNDLARTDDGNIKFADDRGNVKLVVGAARIVFIEAASNYVDIAYIDGERLMRYSLRNTLKGIETLCEAHGLVRCHRSYFINLRRVKLLRHSGDAVFADMDFEGVGSIPVSKSYASDVARQFSQLAS